MRNALMPDPQNASAPSLFLPHTVVQEGSPESGQSQRGGNLCSRTLSAFAAAALVFGSSGAMAQSAAPLGLGNAPAVERAGADTSADNELRGSGRWVIYAIALALIVCGAIELLDDDDSESP